MLTMVSDSIKNAASTIVWDMLQEYKGNATDARKEWQGLLPDPPYAWWLGGVSSCSSFIQSWRSSWVAVIWMILLMSLYQTNIFVFRLCGAVSSITGTSQEMQPTTISLRRVYNNKEVPSTTLCEWEASFLTLSWPWRCAKLSDKNGQGRWGLMLIHRFHRPQEHRSSIGNDGMYYSCLTSIMSHWIFYHPWGQMFTSSHMIQDWLSI